MLWVFMQMAKWACPSWELLHFSHTHKPTRVIRWPWGVGAGWLLGGSVEEPWCVWGGLLGDSEKSTAWRRSKFRGWRGKRSQQSREYVLEKKWVHQESVISRKLANREILRSCYS